MLDHISKRKTTSGDAIVVIMKVLLQIESTPDIGALRLSTIDTASLIKSREESKWNVGLGTALPTRTFNKLREFRREMLKRRLRG